MRTKQEVVGFLESKVGTKVPCVGNPSLDNQCVTLIKSLMEFIGVPNPYKARGHAKTAIGAYVNEGIADNGTGFLSVFSNKNMGGGYGHIWCNAGDGDGEYYESNGVKPLTVTKGKTYSYDSVCNFDKYIKEGEKTMLLEYLGMPNEADAIKRLEEHLGGKDSCEWGNDADGKGGHLGAARRQIAEMEMEIERLDAEIENHKCPVTEVPEPTLNGRMNGYTVEYELNGKIVKENYTVEPAK